MYVLHLVDLLFQQTVGIREPVRIVQQIVLIRNRIQNEPSKNSHLAKFFNFTFLYIYQNC